MSETSPGILKSGFISKMPRIILSLNRMSTISAATSQNCIAKAGMNLFSLDCEYSGYVNKLIQTDLFNKVLSREPSPVLSNTC